MHFILNIKEKFLKLIKEGKKNNEYRLCKKEHLTKRVGDVLILVSDKNNNDYVKVIIEDIKRYSNWENAVKDNWKKDFFGIANSLDEVLKDCYSIYNKKEVEKYGIIAYKIKKEVISFRNASYLLDNKIIIARESSKVKDEEITNLYKVLESLNAKKYYYPLISLDKNNDTNKEVEELIDKLRHYNKIKTTNIKNNEFSKLCDGFTDVHDLSDNNILENVFNGTVDFLITDDRTVIKKSKMLFIDDRVFSIKQFLILLKKQSPELINYEVLSIILESMADIDVQDKFFDTLREDYGEQDFNNWFNKKKKEKAYTFRNGKQLEGFLYLKLEDDKESYLHFEPELVPKKRLKIGTFKTTGTGFRLGERFLKIVFDNALKQKVDEVYTTLFADKRDDVKILKQMLEKWGFIKKAINKKTGEIVLVKDMKNYDEKKDPKFNYPLIKDKYMISFLPILNEFHHKLFPDLRVENDNINFYKNEPYEYAIEKVYVTKYHNKKLKPGDILSIYMMADSFKKYRSVVTGIGILQEINTVYNINDFIKMCGNRTVFTENELKKFHKRKCKTIVKILYLSSLDKKINYNNLINYDIINEQEGPRLSTIIKKENFEKMIKISRGE